MTYYDYRKECAGYIRVHGIENARYHLEQWGHVWPRDKFAGWKDKINELS